MKTISLFGEVWGVGPATALKLYDKGHRTLEDLKNDASLTNAQKLGLQYFDDIKTRIPRHEVSSCAFLFSINRSNLLILLLGFSLESCFIQINRSQKWRNCCRRLEKKFCQE